MHIRKPRHRLLHLPLIVLLCWTAAGAQETLLFESGAKGGRKQTHRIPTAMLSTPTNTVVIYLPPEYETSDRRYPVVYLLNGSGGDYQHFTTWVNAPTKTSDLIAAGRIEPMIVVIPTRPRSSSHLSYTDYLVQELIPFVDTHFRTTADRNGRGIGGWSLGGANALMATLARPDIFNSAAGLAVGGVASQQILDLALDHKQYLYPVAAWMHWGTSDEAVVRPSGILEILGRLSIPHAYLETGGDHTGSLRAYTDSALAFLADHMGAQPPVRVTEATERFAVVAGAVPEALNVALRLGTSTSPGRRIRVDTEELGGAPLRLDDDGAGRYTGRLALPPDLPRGLYRFPVVGVSSDGAEEYLYAIRLSVYPSADETLFDGPAPGWALRPSSTLTTTPGPHEGRQALAMRASGAWTLTLTAPEAVPALGFRAAALFVHPGTAQAPESGISTLRLSVGTAAVDIDVDLSSRVWQEIVVPLADFGLAEGPIYSVRLSGSHEGDLYLADVRLARGRPPVATAVTEGRQVTVPDGFALELNYPNPFNSQTVIGFSLAQPADVSLVVFDLLGQRVATLAQGPRAAGRYTVRWGGRDDAGRALASGVYLYRLRAGDRVTARRLALVR